MSEWPAAKASEVRAALLRGLADQTAVWFDRVLERPGWPAFVFAFHDGEEIGPRMLARIARRTGLQPADL